MNTGDFIFPTLLILLPGAFITLAYNVIASGGSQETAFTLVFLGVDFFGVDLTLGLLV
jgi:hypothetical protein